MEPLFRSAYRAHLLEEDELAQSTISQYCARIDLIEELLHKPIESVTPDDARAIKRMTELSSSYRKGFVVTLHSVHRVGAAFGKWDLNGMMEVRPPKEENDSPLPLPLETARFLLHACRSPREFRVIYLGTLAGLRIGESAMLREQHWQGDYLWFRGAKNRKMREVPVVPRLAAMRDVILSVSPQHVNTLHKAKGRVQKRAQIPFRSQQLRKTFASTLLDNGARWEVVQQLLGHSLGVTGIYAQPTRRMRDVDMAKLPFGCLESAAGV